MKTREDEPTHLRCLAIVPALTEQGSIGAVVGDLCALAAPTVEVVVIDDGSTDATAERARAAGARVVRMPFNTGIGGAVQAGYQLAEREGFDVAIQVDGDGQHPADQVHLLIAHLATTGANYVIGSRFAGHGDYRGTRARRRAISILARLISGLVGFRLTDPTSGFRAADRRTIECFARAYPADYPEAEAIVVAHRLGLTVRELPVLMRPRTSGRSSITPVRSLYYMLKVTLAVLVQCMGRNPARTTSP